MTNQIVFNVVRGGLSLSCAALFVLLLVAFSSANLEFPKLWYAANGQVPLTQGGVEVIDSGDIVMGMNFFFDSIYTPDLRLIDYTLYPNGTVVFVFEGAPKWLDDFGPTDWITPVILEVHTTHRFTPENGYTFNADGSVFTPQGKLLVIETE